MYISSTSENMVPHVFSFDPYNNPVSRDFNPIFANLGLEGYGGWNSSGVISW